MAPRISAPNFPFPGNRDRLSKRLGSVEGYSSREYVLALLRGYARACKPFDGSLHQALHHTVILQEPVGDSTNVFKLHPVSVATLRKELFALTGGSSVVSTLAEESLANIDYLRDSVGPAESKPRHPDIALGWPWPPSANLADPGTAAQKDAADPVAAAGASRAIANQVER